MVLKNGVLYLKVFLIDVVNNVDKGGIIICAMGSQNLNGATTKNGYYF